MSMFVSRHVAVVAIVLGRITEIAEGGVEGHVSPAKSSAGGIGKPVVSQDAGFGSHGVAADADVAARGDVGNALVLRRVVVGDFLIGKSGDPSPARKRLSDHFAAEIEIPGAVQ